MNSNASWSRAQPRPSARLRVLRTLHEAGVPVSVMCAPMIPMINDMELERLLEAAREAGARSAGYVLLRLPHEVASCSRAGWRNTSHSAPPMS